MGGSTAANDRRFGLLTAIWSHGRPQTTQPNHTAVAIRVLCGECSNRSRSTFCITSPLYVYNAFVSAATSLATLDDFVPVMLEAEDENYNLFKLINELNKEVSRVARFSRFYVRISFMLQRLFCQKYHPFCDLCPIRCSIAQRKGSTGQSVRTSLRQ